MAYIPINPERRDPGFFKKKAEIGLPNVDNMSAVELVNAISEDVKILNNKKKFSSKITTRGEFYGGILRTASDTSHASFTLGLFDSSDSSKELASVHVDFAFSCTSADEYGHINYTICCPDRDQYLKDLYLVFSQVQDQLYVTLHSPFLPTRSSKVYFNLIGVNILDWTEGVTRLDPGKDISEIVKNHELSRIRLNGPCSTVGADSANALAVYGGDGRKISLDNLSSLDGYDYPSINGIPFIGKKGLLIGNEETGRHIEVPAYHKDSTREGSGVHDWEVLRDIKKINISKTDTKANPEDSSKAPNKENIGYGLVKPTGYQILSPSSITQTNVIDWLNHLGEDTDVITVGAFKEYMSYLLKFIFNTTIDSYHLYLENSEDLFKYIPSGASSFNLAVNSFTKSIGGTTGGKTISPVTVSISGGWITSEAPENINGLWSIKFNYQANQSDEERSSVITITQTDSGRELKVVVTQSIFNIRYGLLLGETPVYEDSGYSLPRWGNGEITQTLSVVPIKSDNVDSRGYKEITPIQDLFLTNTNSWISGELSKETGELKLSVESNYMSSVRFGTVYVGILETPGGKIKYVPIQCSQAATTSYLHIDDDTNESSVILCTTGKEQVTKRFKISSNYAWVVTKSPFWVTLSGYTGERPSGSSYLTLVISENNTQTTREDIVEITNKGGSTRTIKITQSPRTVYVDINNQAKDQFFSFGSNGSFDVSSVTVNVNSNVNWFIDQCPSWITPSVYDGGEDGVATTTQLTLSMETPQYSNMGEAVSFAYYDEETKTIIALRKITITPSIEGFVDSNKYVFPQSSLTMEVTSEGGPITIGALANTKYKAKFLEEEDGPYSGSDYPGMLVGYGESEFTSEDPKEDPTKQTHITFEITKNESPRKKSLQFILIPVDAVEENMEASEFPVFTVTQDGNKEITPMAFDKTKDISAVSTEDTGHWVYRYSGVVVQTKPTHTPTRLGITDKVYKAFLAQKGQVVLISGEETNLYKSPKEIPEVGDTLEYISSVVREGTSGWYIIKEPGYYFTTTGKATVITTISEKYTCGSERTTFSIALGSVMNNCWDLYNETLPDWISLEKISNTSSFDTLDVIVDENTKSENRSFTLQFYVDSVEKTLASISIEQTGMEITQEDSEVIEVTPIISSGKTSFSSGAFEVGLSGLVKYSSGITVNGVKSEYTYSEYKDSGVGFSLPEGTTGAMITEDSYGKPKLVVSENTTSTPRSFKVTSTYDGKTGELTILQGTSSELQFYTYEDLEIHPDFTTLPLGISRIGFTVTGVLVLNHIERGNEPIVSRSQTPVEIKFPVGPGKIKINKCGFDLSSPDTLEYSGSIKDECVLSFPVTKYSFSEDGELTETFELIEASPVSFEIGQKNGVVTVGNTLLSSSSSGKSMSTKLSFSKFSSLKVTRKDSSNDTGSYMTSNIPTSGATLSGPTEFTVRLGEPLLEYINNKIISFKIVDTDSGTTQKYVHFRYMRALPKIGCKLTSVSYTNDQTIAKIETSSNIGYTSRGWSNNPVGIHIENGEYSTSVAKLDDTRVIIFKSENQPSRKWYKNYATESLILKDADNYGLSKETPIVLPTGIGAKSGFEITLGSEKIASFDDVISSYDLYLPYTGGEATFKIQSYDSFTLEKSQVDTTSTGKTVNNVVVTDSRSKIQAKVGSLGVMEFSLGYKQTNTGTRGVFRGLVKVKSSTRTFTINVYQSSRVGIATITSPKTKIIIPPTGSITFSHVYPGWQITPAHIDSSLLVPLKFPKFNRSEFNANFGSGGGSGAIPTNSDGTSTVLLDYSEMSTMIGNNTLGMKPISQCISSSAGYTTPDKYGIKTAPVDILQTTSSTVPETDSFEVMVRPNSPECGIYQMVGERLMKVSSLTIETKYSENVSTGNTKVTRSLAFYVSSDLFSRTEPYIGSSITLDGETVDIYNSHTVYDRLFKPIVIEYKDSLLGSAATPNTKKIYSPTRYTVIGGVTYAYYNIILETKTTPTSATEISKLTGRAVFELGRIIVDEKYYQDSTTYKLELPITSK